MRKAPYLVLTVPRRDGVAYSACASVSEAFQSGRHGWFIVNMHWVLSICQEPCQAFFVSQLIHSSPSPCEVDTSVSTEAQRFKDVPEGSWLITVTVTAGISPHSTACTLHLQAAPPWNHSLDDKHILDVSKWESISTLKIHAILIVNLITILVVISTCFYTWGSTEAEWFVGKSLPLAY